MLNQKADKNQVFQAKKSLGQNFLIDKNIITFIVDQLEIKPKDIIVEIGPGHGELTQHIIAQKPKKLILIEKDKRLISQLSEEFQENIEIIEGDALKILPELSYKLKPKNYKLIGNIPYYITGHLLRTLGELENKPDSIILTIQKEVAERVCAEPPQMNLLAASVQFWGTPEILKIIDKKKFNPTPKVDSAVIKIETIDKQPVNKKDQDSESFYKLIKILFKQPRKTIWNNLKEELRIMNKELNGEELKQKLIENGINPNDRPQNLSINEIKVISD